MTMDFSRVWSSSGPIDTPDVNEVENGHGTVTPPDNETENWWKNRIDKAMQALQAHSALDWYDTITYDAGVMVRYDGSLYYSLTSSTDEQPDLNPLVWVPYSNWDFDAAAGGWLLTPFGIKFQWGLNSFSGSDERTVSFHTSFTDTVYRVFVTDRAIVGATVTHAISVTEETNDDFTAIIQGSGGSTSPFNWFAIGRDS